MIITCIAHAMFLIELENGMRIITDPVDDSSGYPVKPIHADAVLISHDHHDHSAMSSVAGTPQIRREEGIHTLAKDVIVKAVKAFHDDRNGSLRGSTLLFVIEAEGLRVAHLGDLGHYPEEKQLAVVDPVDVLMVPVGGYYTIDAQQAARTAEMLHAKVVLPMHYKTKANADWPIAGPEKFLERFSPETIGCMPLIRVTAGDLICQKHVCLLEPQYNRGGK